MSISSILMKAVHHRIVTGPSPDAAYLVRSPFKAAKSIFAVLGVIHSGAPVGEDWKQKLICVSQHFKFFQSNLIDIPSGL